MSSSRGVGGTNLEVPAWGREGGQREERETEAREGGEREEREYLLRERGKACSLPEVGGAVFEVL